MLTRILPGTVTILQELRAPAVQGSLRRYLGLLREQQEALNRLNVYPVPDGDTGSNMAATMEAVVESSSAVRVLAPPLMELASFLTRSASLSDIAWRKAPI